MSHDDEYGPLLELSQMRKMPPVARLVGSAVGLALGAAADHPGAGGLPDGGPWLERLGQEPGRVMAELRGLDPAAVPNAAVHSLLSFVHRTPELGASALTALAATPVASNGGLRWCAPLAAFGEAVRECAERCMSAPARLPMEPSTVLVCVDGSRLSYLALEVGATVRKHGRLVVLHVAEPPLPGKGEARPDLSVSFLEADLTQRCREQLRIAPHQVKVVTVAPPSQNQAGSSSSPGGAVSQRAAPRESFTEACERVVAEEAVDVVVMGCYGNAGARIGTLGSNAHWGSHHGWARRGTATILANPYSSPVPPLHEGGVDAMRPALFMVVVKAERPLNEEAIRATMRLMSHWHSLVVYVLLNEQQTRAMQSGATAQPPLDPVIADLKQMLVDARLVAGVERGGPSPGSGAASLAGGCSVGGSSAGGGDDAAPRRSSVKVEPFNPQKTPEQLIVRCADAERVDFLAMDTKDDVHDGVIKACRASVILLTSN